MKTTKRILAWACVIIIFIPTTVLYGLAYAFKEVGEVVTDTLDPVPTHLRNWVDKYK